jgi:hypothetical protein
LAKFTLEKKNSKVFPVSLSKMATFFHWISTHTTYAWSIVVK